MDGRPVICIIPPGTIIDGAIAELAIQPDGTVAADIRINGPAVP